MRNSDEMEFPIKRIISTVGIIVALICAYLFIGGATATVENGTYQINQLPITGTVSAHMQPGMYMRTWGRNEPWPVSDTFYFTADAQEGAEKDQSIEVRFNDGATANISGTCRVILPKTEEEVLALVSKYGYRSYKDLEMKLILPTIRNSLMMSAVLMSSRESYSDKRPEFVNWTWDQIQHGLYVSEDVQGETEDPATGQKVYKTVKRIKLDAEGKPVRSSIAPFVNTGISLSNFEIKNYLYDVKVKEQISTQQENMMAIQTSMSKALRAEQENKTAEQEGQKKVTEAKYTAMVEKETAKVAAEKEMEVAKIGADQKKAVATIDLEVASLATKKAEQEKLAAIAKGEGESKARQLVLEADGALKAKLETLENINKTWADAFSKRSVPSIFMAGSGGNGDTKDSSPDGQFHTFMDLQNMAALKQLQLDLTVPNKTAPVAPQKQ